MIVGGFFNRPYLTIDFIVVSHKFNPTPYIRDISHRKSIHKRIRNLSNEGLGYRRIHRVLVSEGFDIGKSPTCVHSMIKKMKERERILSQKTEIRIGKVGIEVFRRG